MDSTLTLVLLCCAAAATVMYGLGIVSAWLHTRSRHAPAMPRGGWPDVSLVKPVKGLEEDLERCLEAFFTQDYEGAVEVVFAAADRKDPALEVARRVAERHPEVPSRFVLTDENWGFNPKLANMAGAIAAARHDLVLQTDANVWVPPNYLRQVVGELHEQDASVLSSMVTGTGEQSVGAAIENLQLTGFVGPACCAALKVVGVPCVIGKSILMRKSELEELGGIGQFRDLLAEDFVLGKHFTEAGRKVLLSPTPIYNVNVDIPVERSFQRHSRWLKMRAVVHVPGFIADIFANPLAFLTPAMVASGFDGRVTAAWVGLVVSKFFIDGWTIERIRGEGMALRYRLLGPLKDLLMAVVWLYAIFSRSVEWRGKRFTMRADSKLEPYEEALARRLIRRLFA